MKLDTRPFNRRVLVVGVLAILIVSLMISGQRLSISGYQGIHPSFAAVWDDGRLYSPESIGSGASVARFQESSLNFDPDGAETGMPNMMGALRDITVVNDLSQYVPIDTLDHIRALGGSTQPNQPYRTYTWKLDNGDGTSAEYLMQNWLCTFDVNLWAKPDVMGPLSTEHWNQRYRDAEVWLKLSTGPDWIFEGADETYYGLAYMELAQFQQTGTDSELVVVPGAKWEALPIYASLNGYAVSPADASTYQGKRLNPDIFRDEWYTCVTLGSFGTYDHVWIDGSYKSDSVTLRILTHIFVVGEWTVRNDADHPIDPHQPPTATGWLQASFNWVAGVIGGVASFSTETLRLLASIAVVGLIGFGLLIFSAIYLGRRR